jgi:tetratricopeptide (TPR) repeat protein
MLLITEEPESSVETVSAVQLDQKSLINALTKMANLYKESDNWLKSAECFVKLARLETGQASMLAYADAGEMYKHINHTLAIESYERATELCVLDGKFDTAHKYMICITEILEADGEWLRAMTLHSTAQIYESYVKKQYIQPRNFSKAEYMKRIAEILEKRGEWSKAISAYTRAYVSYAEESPSWKGNECLLKAKNICIKIEDYTQAILLLDKLIDYYDSSRCTTFKCCELIAELVMCQIILGQTDPWDQIMTKYNDICSQKYRIIECLKAIFPSECWKKIPLELFNYYTSDLRLNCSGDCIRILIPKIKEVFKS